MRREVSCRVLLGAPGGPHPVTHCQQLSIPIYSTNYVIANEDNYSSQPHILSCLNIEPTFQLKYLVSKSK